MILYSFNSKIIYLMLVNSYDVLKLMFLYKIGRPFDKFQSLLQFGVQEQTTNILS